MKFKTYVAVTTFSLWGLSLASAGPIGTELDTATIENLTGLKGTFNAKDVFTVTYPRSDLRITVGGVAMTPPMGLTAWAAFTKVGQDAAVMGDMVLLEDQVNPVMDAALDNGLEVTALHNHFMWDSPKVMFMHLSGMGPERKLAAGVGAVFSKLKETIGGKGEVPQAGIDASQTSLDAQKLGALLGAKGVLAHGVLKFVFGRTTAMDGHEMDASMGVNTWAAFIGKDDKAVVDGDFAMKEGEVQGVLKALRRSKIYIVAIHSHMLLESPRIIFLHYWGVGPAASLASGIRAALNETKP